MTLAVIGAGVGRTATFSLKFALERLGFGPCHHMSEVFADARRQLPLWLDAIDGNADWDAIFAGFRSTTDYPACTYWHELAAHYPRAKVILSVRDPDAWFESVSETILPKPMRGGAPGARVVPMTRDALRRSPVGALMQGAIFDAFGHRIGDRKFMIEWFVRRNQAVVDALPAERLLVFDAREGWEPLCAFLGVGMPAHRFPHVNGRDEIAARRAEPTPRAQPPDPETSERMARDYIDLLKAEAFG